MGKAEKMQAEYEERFRSMQHEMERRKSELDAAQETIKKLEDQLRETQVAKEELMQQQNELRDMMTRLEEDKNLEAEERARLEEEINSKKKEMDEARKRNEEASKALIAATTTPKHHHLQEMDGTSDDEDEERMPNGDLSRDLRQDDDDLRDPVNERLTLAEKNERLQSQLRGLKEDLANTRDDQQETTMDKIHRENVKQGRDKYKTLREVRKCNTKRRVDQFENM